MTHPDPVCVLQALVRKSHDGLSGRLDAKDGFVEWMATGAPQYVVVKK